MTNIPVTSNGVATIADLKKLTPQPGNVVSVGGYHRVGDKGGGVFYAVTPDANPELRQPDGALPTDDGIFIEPESGDGRWMRLYQNAVYAEWFGAKGDNHTNDQVAIQNAIDFAIQNNVLQVRLGDGVFRIEDTLHLGYGNAHCNVSLVGSGKRWYNSADIFGGTVLRPTFGARPAIAIQGALRTALRELTLQGCNNNFLYQNIHTEHSKKALKIVDPAEWVDPALPAHADSRYAPYAAIAIDPYSGPQPEVSYPAVNYPAWTGIDSQYENGYSVGVEITDVEMEGFVVGIVTQPGNYQGNGEYTKIRNCGFRRLKYGISVGGWHAGDISIQDCEYQVVHTFMTVIEHGQQRGRVVGAIENIYGHIGYQFVDMPSPHVIPLGFKNVRFEQQIKFGRLGTNNAGFHSPIVFESCYFESSSRDYDYYPDVFIESNVRVPMHFIGCTFRFNKFLNLFSGFGIFVVLDSCTIVPIGDNEPYPAAQVPAANYLCGGLFCLNPPEIHGVLNSQLVSEHGSGAFPFSNTVYEYDGTMKNAHPGIRSVVHQGARRLSLTASNFQNVFAPIKATKPRIFIHKEAQLTDISVRGVTLTFVDTRQDQYQNVMQVGDLLLDQPTSTLFVIDKIEDVEANKAVTATAITNYYMENGQKVLNIPEADIQDSQHFILVPCSIFKTDYEYRGNSTKGSNVITNVRRPDGYSASVEYYFQPGDMLFYHEEAVHWDVARPFPQITHVVSADAEAKTITVDQPAVEDVKDFTLGIGVSW